MRKKFIFVTGGVVSSVGKGIVTSSIGKMLQARGFSVTAIKADPYVNVDAGTMNPFAHGEVFVTEDGGETDLDIGWYERFLDKTLRKHNNITTGQVYGEVIARERKGEYLGQCVQIVPHVTDEIKRRIRKVAQDDGCDITLVEIGGTAGDIEGLPFLEAIRQMRLEEGYDNTVFIHVALVPTLWATGELKTKALQHSVNELRRIGIQPDMVVVRSNSMIDDKTKAKVALFSSLPKEAIFCSYDVDYVYELPLVLEDQGMGYMIVRRLKLKPSKPSWEGWDKNLQGLRKPEAKVDIAICGKYTKLADSYVSVREALIHAGAYISTKVNLHWVDTEVIEKDAGRLEGLRVFDGILVPGGFGSRGAEGKIEVIRFARENNIPFLGICFGMQLAIVEFSRNACGLTRANSSEIDPNTPHPVIDLLPDQVRVEEKGATMRLGSQPIVLKRGSLAYSLYGSAIIHQRHRHRYEVNEDYWGMINEKGMEFSGFSPDGKRIEVIEIPSHFYFIATQFHPEFKSRLGKPDPAYLGFVKAARDRKEGKRRFEIPIKEAIKV